MIYEISNGLKPLSSEGKNELPKGTMLRLNGYDNPRYVIAQNMGIDAKYGYGARYLCINLTNLHISQHEAITLKHISEKKDGRIQTYILDEPLMSEIEVKRLLNQANEKQAERNRLQQEAKAKTEQAIEKGKGIIAEKVPPWAKAVIVGYKEIDDCDSMTDYFNTKSEAPYILAWSKHTRDIFSEMRKAAANMEETKHLSIVPDIDQSGDKKSDRNKEWWHPSDEHREKYSMGAGYYLKATHRYSTGGWKVCKWDLGRYRMESIYLAAGEGRFKIPDNVKEQVATPNQVDGITVSENEEKDGVEIRFPGKPEVEVRDNLKSHGFRWSRFGSCWYKKRSPEALSFANSLI